MTALTEPIQVAKGGPATPAPAQVLSQSDILSTASSVIQTYPSITSAYLFGSYAKGTARPDSDVDIALFLDDLRWDKLVDIGGVLMDLEIALHRKVDLAVRPPQDFVEIIKTYWVPINVRCGEPGTVSLFWYLFHVSAA